MCTVKTLVLHIHKHYIYIDMAAGEIDREIVAVNVWNLYGDNIQTQSKNMLKVEVG